MQKTMLADIHKLIHSNLKQLDLLHPIKFTIKEEMFKVMNIKGFQETIHYLLKIVDAEKCARMVPWPILDKKMESQFRIGVKNFLESINEQYPEANLPKLFPAVLMTPGGDKFAYYMWKLTKFVLLKALRDKYGDDQMLFPPRTSKDDKFVKAKMNLLQSLIQCETQNSISLQKQIDTMTPQNYEWQHNIELNQLDEEIRKLETELQDEAEIAPVSPRTREKLRSIMKDRSGIEEWVKELEEEHRSLEAMEHFLSRRADVVSQLSNTLTLLGNHKISQLCIDANQFIGSGIPKDLEARIMCGKITLSDFIHSLNQSHTTFIYDVQRCSALRSVERLTPDLESAGADLEDCSSMYSDVEKRIQERLKEVESNLSVLLSERRSSKRVTENGTCEMSESDNVDGACALSMITPLRGNVENIIKKRRPTFRGDFDMNLFMSPNIEQRVCISDITIQDDFLTPMKFRGTSTCIKKAPKSDLRSLTSSIVRKKRLELLHKAQTDIKTRAKKNLASPLLEDGSWSSCVPLDSSDMERSGESTVARYSHADKIGSSSSPSELIARRLSEEEDIQPTTTKKTGRKSLDALIQRYHSIRQKQNMHTSAPS